MIDSFPYDSWFNADGSLNPDISPFWTFGPAGGHDLTGTFVLTGLGMLLMVASLIYWVWLENRKLTAQATLLRQAGIAPTPSGPVHGAGPSQPPFAGPSTDPGA